MRKVDQSAPSYLTNFSWLPDLGRGTPPKHLLMDFWVAGEDGWRWVKTDDASVFYFVSDDPERIERRMSARFLRKTKKASQFGEIVRLHRAPEYKDIRLFLINMRSYIQERVTFVSSLYYEHTLVYWPISREDAEVILGDKKLTKAYEYIVSNAHKLGWVTFVYLPIESADYLITENPPGAVFGVEFPGMRYLAGKNPDAVIPVFKTIAKRKRPNTVARMPNGEYLLSWLDSELRLGRPPSYRLPNVKVIDRNEARRRREEKAQERADRLQEERLQEATKRLVSQKKEEAESIKPIELTQVGVLTTRQERSAYREFLRRLRASDRVF